MHTNILLLYLTPRDTHAHAIGGGTPRPGRYQARKRRARDHRKQKIQEPRVTGSAARGQQLSPNPRNLRAKWLSGHICKPSSLGWPDTHGGGTLTDPSRSLANAFLQVHLQKAGCNFYLDQVPTSSGKSEGRGAVCTRHKDLTQPFDLLSYRGLLLDAE